MCLRRSSLQRLKARRSALIEILPKFACGATICIVMELEFGGLHLRFGTKLLSYEQAADIWYTYVLKEPSSLRSRMAGPVLLGSNVTSLVFFKLSYIYQIILQQKI